VSRYIWVLDPGHGGMVDGVYQTKGKQYHYPGGPSIYEGVVNRVVAGIVARALSANNISCVITVTGPEDMPLKKRVAISNEIDNSVFVSIHCNAGGGTGYEVYHCPGSAKGRALATTMAKYAASELPELKQRGIKAKAYYVLKHTKGPAVLIENAFMDTLKPDCMMLLRQPQRFAGAIVRAIMEIEERGL